MITFENGYQTITFSGMEGLPLPKFQVIERTILSGEWSSLGQIG
jgi:hypothetical protein